jgi:cardiolipin synthase
MNAGRHFPDIEEAGEKLLMVLCSRARRNVKPVHESYLSAMKNARHSIYITNAYFVPDAKIFRKLIKAAERGVDVRLLLPGESDIAIVKYASMYLYKRYLKNNIRIFEYQQSILHAKTAVIDGVWSTVGSSNLDRRSFRKNLEMNVVVLDQRFGDQMEVMFMKDLEKSKEIILQKFQRRSLYLFLLEWLCYRFRNLL